MYSAQFATTTRITELARTLQAALERCGFDPIDTPIIQAADLFLTRAGDQIVSRLFTFERHSALLALRPEFTAIAAHHYVRSGLRGVVRWQFGGAIFEDDPTRTDRQYQQYSVGAELIGRGGVLAEAELIEAALEGLRAANVADARLVVGHVGLMRRLLARFSLDARTERFVLAQLDALKDPARGMAYALEQLDRLTGRGGEDADERALMGDDPDAQETNTQQMLDALLDATQRNVTMGGRTRLDIVRRLLRKRQRVAKREQVVAALTFLDAWTRISAAPDAAFAAVEQLIDTDDSESRAALARWRELLALLDLPDGYITVQPALERSWEYYTGVVFELYDGDGRHLGGGGRYDELIRLVGGEGDVPAVGFVYYLDTLLEASPPQPELLPILVGVAAGADPWALAWLRLLRENGFAAALTADDDAVIGLRADGSADYDGQTFRLDESDSLVQALR